VLPFDFRLGLAARLGLGLAPLGLGLGLGLALFLLRLRLSSLLGFLPCSAIRFRLLRFHPPFILDPSGFFLPHSFGLLDPLGFFLFLSAVEAGHYESDDEQTDDCNNLENHSFSLAAASLFFIQFKGAVVANCLDRGVLDVNARAATGTRGASPGRVVPWMRGHPAIAAHTASDPTESASTGRADVDLSSDKIAVPDWLATAKAAVNGRSAWRKSNDGSPSIAAYGRCRKNRIETD
jgi:hypothetical protein